METPWEVELTTARLAPESVYTWARPAVESGDKDITVRQVFTAKGPCRVLTAELIRRYPGEFMLRVEATAASAGSRCGEETPHIGYTAVLTGLPTGRHHLRIVHVGADGSTLADAVLEHPIIVTARPGAGE